MKPKPSIFIFFLALFWWGCEDDVEEIQTADPILKWKEETAKEEEISCAQDVCWDETVFTCRDTIYNNHLTRYSGWTGGDAAYCVDLKDRRTLWAFGDTFIDQVNDDRERPSFNLINNSLMIQDGEAFITYHGGTPASPDAYLKPPETGEWYWPADGTVVDGKLLLFMHGFGSNGSTMWSFFRTSIDLFTINLQTLEVEDTLRIARDPTISWGAAIMEKENETYIYGVQQGPYGKELYVARSAPDLAFPWLYFDGNGWVAQEDSSAAIHWGVSEQVSVFEDGNTTYLLTQDGYLGSKIYLSSGTSPSGPFEDERTVYCTPETGGNLFTYNALAHPHVYEDALLVSYNINSFDFQDLKDADNYRPYFVKIDGWKK